MLESISTIDIIDSSFKYIYAAAKSMKCYNFFVDKLTNRLYGTPMEPYNVHVIKLPFEVKNNLIFQIFTNTTSIEDIERHEYNMFQSGVELRYSFIPMEYLDDYLSSNLRMIGERIFNLKTKEFIQSVKTLASPDEIYKLDVFINQVNSVKSFILNRSIGREPYFEYFSNIEKLEQMQRIYNSKVSDGKFIITFGEQKKCSLIIFKGFLNAAKADSVDLCLYYDNPMSSLSRFMVKHKKNIFKELTKENNPEEIYCRFMNI